ncbi:MAG TPA: hypothetical protein VMT90_07675 [Dehalococcoidia bacterium]|nr:hypothetical protein [Dehalococcoidia bacterium]
MAIERQEWEVAALVLLLGVTRAARLLPPETLEAMIDLLEESPPHRRRERRRRGHP